MIDEMATTETNTTTAAEAETFDLDAAITAHLAQRDQEEAARKEAEERKARERFEQERDALWGYLTSVLPAEVIAGLGITGPEVIEPYNGYDVSVPFVVDGATWHIMSSGDSQFLVRGPDYFGVSGWVGPSALLGWILGSIATYRQERAARARHAVAAPDTDDLYATDGSSAKGAPAKTWEPQVLGSDDYRTTYLLDVDTGCGSLTQHALTVAEINRAGDVIVSQLFPGRVRLYGDDERAPKAVVEYQLSGTQLRALWPLWQQMTAEKAEQTKEQSETNEVTAYIPF